MFVNTFLSKSALLVFSSVLAASGMAQESDYEVPRTAFGVPDLQGTWNIATVTMLERDAKFNGKCKKYEQEENQF